MRKNIDQNDPCVSLNAFKISYLSKKRQKLYSSEENINDMSERIIQIFSRKMTKIRFFNV